ncbi:hypothetical protein EVAR_70739_1 [Eumeta japonica]|uniref:Histone-lysine N-methyltransferase SETMAR n=1 Tax=Eumeta variegata TaxID=151549 RepID=A0A4C2ADS1_EUMVA|nr:hypothetical protein EVAR_70739_1 [Eumeta japonica]
MGILVTSSVMHNCGTLKQFIRQIPRCQTVIREARRPARDTESLLTSARIHQVQKYWLTHPPYSPDLARCDFYLFPKVKFRRNWFTDVEEVVDAYEKVIEITPK